MNDIGFMYAVFFFSVMLLITFALGFIAYLDIKTKRASILAAEQAS